jgi:putative ABC transport system substrate-binding protein
MAIIGDPVAAGLVESLARPGGNATGFSIVAPDLSGKRLELLKEIVPAVSPVAVMLNSRNPQSQFELKEMETAARVLGLQIHPIEISPERPLEQGFAAMSQALARSLIVLTDPIFFSRRERIVELAASNRLPAMYFFQDFVEAGGLLSYGPSDTDLYRRAATYVDRVLKGAKPSELPVEQPTKFDLAVNLKAAKALGLEISPMVLTHAPTRSSTEPWTRAGFAAASVRHPPSISGRDRRRAEAIVEADLGDVPLLMSASCVR